MTPQGPGIVAPAEAEKRLRCGRNHSDVANVASQLGIAATRTELDAVVDAGEDRRPDDRESRAERDPAARPGRREARLAVSPSRAKPTPISAPAAPSA